MKRLFSIALLVSVFFLVLNTGCGSSNSSTTPIVSPPPLSAPRFAFIRGSNLPPSIQVANVVALRSFRGTPSTERAHLLQTRAATALPTGSYTLLTMKNDGSGETAIPNSSSYFSTVVLSSDEKKVVFIAPSATETGYYHIFTMKVDGTGLAELTTDADGLVDEPMFTPNATQIFYRAYPK
jgi:hypothetical protein